MTRIKSQKQENALRTKRAKKHRKEKKSHNKSQTTENDSDGESIESFYTASDMSTLSSSWATMSPHGSTAADTGVVSVEGDLVTPRGGVNVVAEFSPRLSPIPCTSHAYTPTFVMGESGLEGDGQTESPNAPPVPQTPPSECDNEVNRSLNVSVWLTSEVSIEDALKMAQSTNVRTASSSFIFVPPHSPLVGVNLGSIQGDAEEAHDGALSLALASQHSRLVPVPQWKLIEFVRQNPVVVLFMGSAARKEDKQDGSPPVITNVHDNATKIYLLDTSVNETNDQHPRNEHTNNPTEKSASPMHPSLSRPSRAAVDNKSVLPYTSTWWCMMGMLLLLLCCVVMMWLTQGSPQATRAPATSDAMCTPERLGWRALPYAVPVPPNLTCADAGKKALEDVSANISKWCSGVSCREHERAVKLTRFVCNEWLRGQLEDEIRRDPQLCAKIAE